MLEGTFRSDEAGDPLSTSSIPDTPFVKEVSELTSVVNQSTATKPLFWEDGYRRLSFSLNTKGEYHAVGS
jgi:hypothetical protein